MSFAKRGSDDELEGPALKIAKRDDSTDEDTAKSKSGRIRKKSAKVLEMEEFEEAEKKQFSKKSDVKSKTPTLVTTPIVKKTKPKLNLEDSVSVPTTAVDSDVLTAGQLQGSVVTSFGSISSSPVKASTKQAVGTKVRDNQGSVIKLLLSSPANPSAVSVSTNVITKTSPTVAVSSPSASPLTAQIMAVAAKKGIIKVKTESMPLIKHEPFTDLHDSETIGVKTEPAQSCDQYLFDTVISQDSLASNQIFKTESADASTVKSETRSLKMKLIMSPKDSTSIDQAFPTSRPIPNLFGGQEETSLTSDKPNHSSVIKKKVLPKKKRPTSVDVKTEQESHKIQSAAEQMPNLAALVSASKSHRLAPKEEINMGMPDGVDTSLSDASMDMSSIVDSALDMEEEAALVIAEGGTSNKPKKKRISGTSKKRLKAQTTEMGEELVAVEQTSAAPAEGDIAALAAKVQCATNAMDVKKKSSKKLHISGESSGQIVKGKKYKKPPRRAPTAYMLFCNAQRPKVVYESPGIDFAQISRTLGVMWQCLSKKEKMMWRRKSKKLAGKGSTLISTGKGSKKEVGGLNTQTPSAQPVMRMPAASKTSRSASSSSTGAAMSGEDTPQSPVKGFGIEPIDIAAHLKLLGESLSIIGMRLQEHKGLIAVQGSLSVLLDSMLCACGPLLVLTQQVPRMNGCSESTHARTLDSVAYIMPGL